MDAIETVDFTARDDEIDGISGRESR